MVEIEQTAEEMREIWNKSIENETEDEMKLTPEKRELVRSIMCLMRDHTCNIRKKIQITKDDTEESKQEKTIILDNYLLKIYDLRLRKMFGWNDESLNKRWCSIL